MYRREHIIGPRGIVLSCEILRCDPVEQNPKVSIITTVYDRVRCLERCRRSLSDLQFSDFEHIVMADAPPSALVKEIENVVSRTSSGKGVTVGALEQRHNDWGICPAAMALSLARGQYVCFLSDDNGYAPHHFCELVQALDRDKGVGFVYSSCLYKDKWILNDSPPVWGKIDLGQPLFRRELFDIYFGGTLPFYEYGWDWRMIDSLMRHNVRWQHIDQPTFIFRLTEHSALT